MLPRVLSAVSVCLVFACGGKPQPPPSSSPTPTGAASPAPASGTPGAAAPAPSGAAAPTAAAAAADAGPPPPAHPFANTGAEASELIDKAVDTRREQIKKCVEDARARRKDPHAKIVVELGIDQEGTLIGVKSPAGVKSDEALFSCVRDALRDAPFPRSHAGVITVKKWFEDVWIYPK
jgi:hypothetical protein